MLQNSNKFYSARILIKKPFLSKVQNRTKQSPNNVAIINSHPGIGQPEIDIVTARC